MGTSINLPEDDAEVTYKKGNTIWLTGITIAVAEFIGTALLIFGTCMGCTIGTYEGSAPILQVSLASGLSVTTAIQVVGHISGAHVNPAITLCALIMGEIPLTQVPIYVGSQIGGSLTGYALLMAATPDKYFDGPGQCVNTPHDEISLMQACLVEFLATIILALAVCASWDPKNSANNDSISLRIGLVVVLLNITAGYYTGASMNPARSFAPALWNHNWHAHWVFILFFVYYAYSSSAMIKKCSEILVYLNATEVKLPKVEGERDYVFKK